ncbi:MAG: hypothetical protein A3G32_08165 [Deltaproteobacteria bacterium RIFCSPLOWO2_12_FULL_40_28]|nr:MAG: hypothetical protein A3C45_00865 [Deltaproteobacteria bacterium RIFCSPHIGHO2_02_FULL_40_28]OGQ20884.1 MAG: hypothetical protein A3E27_03530 [Deltaproteobacteria bacterium RIFCSPHIGHO2_12_FULL_40_32]OGQ39285.1 MAG: hypothetical protein A3I69_04890 [Deltaproteobacteria bacterium RIFCSPLOWO2_02_FULL_40_36]OGQ54566.1 MAG: hypothetical protein A3G32_08165 [Deltaproteobacteria bacterium RIFCSPLOWO2_12_FULL_40_28]
MSELVKNYFDSISSSYDVTNRLLSFGRDLAWREKAVCQLASLKDKNSVILDLCAGTLDLTLETLNFLPLSRVSALDFSKKMLDQGKDKIPPAFLNRVSLVRGDALNTPFSDETFDAILCGYGFRNLDHPQNAILEIKRLLKPGGIVLLLDFFKPQRFFSRLFYATYGRYIMPWIGGLISGNGEAYHYLNRSIDNFFTLDEAKNLFSKEGFSFYHSHDFFFGISSLMCARKVL